MKTKFLTEFVVGIFIICGVISLFILAFKVSSFSDYSKSNTVRVFAEFDNIGDLKVRAPVKIAGVRVGEVGAIGLNNGSFRARVTLQVAKNSVFPNDSSASILSASLLGSNYISITPGFSEKKIANGDEITETNSAMVLEHLIGQAIFTPKDKKE